MISIKEGVKKRVFYSQTDHKVVFFGIFKIYNSTCPDQARKPPHLELRLWAILDLFLVKIMLVIKLNLPPLEMKSSMMRGRAIPGGSNGR